MSMEAGEELDRLIHEKVMDMVSPLSSAQDQKEYEKIRGVIPPSYSTDIAAAWEVVDQVDKKGFTFSIESHFNGAGRKYYKWSAVFGDRINNNNGTEGYTAPHAICLAALKAVGVEA